MNCLLVKGKKFNIIKIFKNKKNISAKIDNNTVTLIFPRRISKADYEKFYGLMIDKIKRKIEKNISIYYNENDKLLEILDLQLFTFNREVFKIHFHKLKILKSKGREIYLNRDLEIDEIRKKIIKFLELYFSDWIKQYVYNLNKKLGFKYKKVTLKYVKSKWGHCTGDNDILINLKLLNGDRKFLDYIIIHELCHTKIKKPF